MGVTFIAPAEQFTSPAKLITKEITEDGTYYAADDNANGHSSVEVSVGGGGGGDFSTAEVTVIVEGDGDYNSITAPLIDGNQATGIGEPQDETTVFTVVLYKGTALAEIDIVGGVNPTIVSGNITLSGDVFTITGDGSIVIS